MTFILWRKLVRDLRVPLLVVTLFIMMFEGFWVKVTERVTTNLTPIFQQVAIAQNRSPKFFEEVVFHGPGKVFQTLIGGESVGWEKPNELLVVGLMHPLAQIIFCIWAVGRAGNAIAGEIDRGTMELLLAQPMRRSRIVLAHLGVDLVCIPVICLACWAGTYAGCWAIGPFAVDPAVYEQLRMKPPAVPVVLTVDPSELGPGLWNVASLLFAVSGYTMLLSARGRSRNRVIGLAILLTLVQFLINFLGQIWEGVAFLRPFTVFYYYQPQLITLKGTWTADPLKVWGRDGEFPLNVIAVLILVGVVSYGLALRHFVQRDIPAPL